MSDVAEKDGPLSDETTEASTGPATADALVSWEEVFDEKLETIGAAVSHMTEARSSEPVMEEIRKLLAEIKETVPVFVEGAKSAAKKAAEDAVYRARSAMRAEMAEIVKSAVKAALAEGHRHTTAVEKKQDVCFVCEGEHAATRCPTFPHGQARFIEMIKREKCVRCAEKHAEDVPCRNQYRHCPACGNESSGPYHLPALCAIRYPLRNPAITLPKQTRLFGGPQPKRQKNRATPAHSSTSA
uniref:Uncharacterized protein n=1 Tax=Caenorhabditis japonica TaxID=281687 RepID=A0A8R1E6L9_CAEJA